MLEVEAPGGIARWAMVGVVGAEWVPLSFLLALAGLQLLAGRLADMIGRKPVLLVGLIVFSVASALCGRWAVELYLARVLGRRSPQRRGVRRCSPSRASS
jgi:MFS family permease